MNQKLRDAFAKLLTTDMYGIPPTIEYVLERLDEALVETQQTIVPVNPSPGLLASMAMRWDHSFGLDRQPHDAMEQGYTPEGRRSLLGSMSQLYEEVVGKGFYQPQKEENYARVGSEGGLPW